MMKRIIAAGWTLAGIVAFPMAAFAYKPAPAPLMTEWGEKMTPETAWRAYPRPQMTRTQWTCLNGLWQYAVTAVTNTPGRPTKWDGEILVPFAPESALSGVGRLIRPDEFLWYTRKIVCSPKPGERILLHFDGVDFRAQVYIGHVEVTDVPHSGAQEPFTLDITPYVKNGENELTVCVWDPTDDFIQSRGKQSLEPKGCFYTRTSGIWQSVWMETVPESHLTDYSVAVDLAKGTATLAFKVAGPRAGDIRLEVFDGDSLVASAAFGPDEKGVVSLPGNFKRWSPESPNLYTFKARYGADGIGGYFAMRSFEVKKDARGIPRFHLNGAPYFAIGTLDQGWWPDGLLTPPSDEAMAHDILTLKKCGFNMMRKHIKVEPRRYYHFCDKLGLLVFQDMPSSDRASIAPIRADVVKRYGLYRHELKSMLDNLMKVPSIVAWVPYNEGWSQPGEHLTHATLDFVRRYDPSRPVDGPSGCWDWDGGHLLPKGWAWSNRVETAHKPAGVCEASDMVDMHLYRGPTMFAVNDRRASFLGEFGGLGHAVSNHLWRATNTWGYGGLSDTAARAGLEKAYVGLMEKLAALAARGLAGSVYTQTTDVEIEINGLMTYDRKVLKYDPNVLAAAHRRVLEAAQVPPEAFRVGSYNIRCPAKVDMDAKNFWTDRRADLVDRVRKMNLDVFGMQEVTPEQAAYLREQLPEFAFVGEYRNADRASGEASPVFYRKSRFTAEDSGTFWLSETPEVAGSKSWDTACTRVCSYLILVDRTTGQRFCFANTHTDHRSAEAREKGMLLVIERMKKFGKGAPIIFTGDHNCNETEPPARAVAKILDNALYRTETQPQGSWRTWNGWRWRDSEVSTVEALRLPIEQRNTKPGSPDSRKESGEVGASFYERCGGPRIDYIYVTPGTRILEYETVSVARPGKAQYPSDHFPLAATVVLPVATVHSSATNGVASRWFEEMVPMKDGTKLYTYGVLPPKGVKCGIVLTRNPYVAEKRVDVAAFARSQQKTLERGYACICQHVRGTGMSEGDWIPYVNERADGLATLEWIRRLPHYNGEIFIKGGSYLSSVHWSYLGTNPPDVKGAVLNIQEVNRYNIHYRNGHYKMGLHGNWAVKGYKKKNHALKRDPSVKFTDLPLKGFSVRRLGEYVADLEDVWQHPRPADVWWQTPGTAGGEFRRALLDSTMPVMMVTGFYDIYTEGIFDMWRETPIARRANCAVVVDAFDHSGRRPKDLPADSAARFPDGSRHDEGVVDSDLDWFDWCRGKGALKTVHPGETRWYALWENKWHHAPEMNDNPKTFTLSFTPDMRLAAEVAPASSGKAVSFAYDPKSPPEFPGAGCLTFGGLRVQPEPGFRKDVLSFVSAPLERRFDVQGRMALSLSVTSDCDDTAFYVRVSVRKADGRWYTLRDDIKSISWDNPAYIPGSEARLDFRLSDHAFRLEKGDSLRVDVAGANAQAFVPHTNFKGPFVEQAKSRVAHNAVIAEKCALTLPVSK